MDKPRYATARTLAEQVRRETERLEAFALGYVHGAQDMDSDIEFKGPDDFNTRLRMLYAEEYNDSYIGEPK